MRNPSTSAALAAARTVTPCCSKVGIKRGPWTAEEDKILAGYINKEGEGRWRTLPKRAGLQRCGKSCRLRWMNYLRPCVKRGRITPDEEDLILRLHRLLGNRWSLIAGRIPGRTDNEIKNYWNTHLSKKLISQGIDPRNHKPLPTSPNTSSPPQVDHNPTSLSNPNPRNSEATNKGMVGNENNPNLYNEAAGAIVGEDCSVDDGILMKDGGYSEDHHIKQCNEVDTFSSFLDSLINESAFATHHHQPPHLPAPPPPAHAFDDGSFWEAELIRSTMEALGDINTHHHHTT